MPTTCRDLYLLLISTCTSSRRFSVFFHSKSRCFSVFFHSKSRRFSVENAGGSQGSVDGVWVFQRFTGAIRGGLGRSSRQPVGVRKSSCGHASLSFRSSRMESVRKASTVRLSLRAVGPNCR